MPRLVRVEGIKTLLPAGNQLARLATTGLVIGLYLLYAGLLFWTAPTAQGPLYDGPHRLPSLTPPELAALVMVLALPVLPARRWPVAAYGAILAESVLAAQFGARSWGVFAAAVVMVCYLALERSATLSTVAAACMVLAWYLEQALIVPQDMASDVATTTGQMALYAACGWGAGYALRKRRQYAARLREQSAASAVMAERLRIARELHDIVAHSIGIIAVLAGAAGRVIETQPQQAREALAGIEATSRETLTGLQRMLSALRRAEPEDGEPAPLAPPQGLADLDQLLARAADAGLEVEMAWHGERRELPAQIDQSVFRVVQEAVTNVVRHSGARTCRVCIGFEQDGVSIEVLDNGHGGAHPQSGAGFGLLGMRERVALLSGQFSAGPRPEGGFRVAAKLPA